MPLPAVRGGLLPLLAAALFGVRTPLIQHFGEGLGAFTTACLLHAGAAAVGAPSRQRVEREARLLRSDQRRSGGTQRRGLLAVLFATAARGTDNTLSRALAEGDPGQVVLGKAAIGAVATPFPARVARAGERRR